ncbi:MarR family winged helix-turn-helix transcriptional regulator [Actinomadura sp. WMMB 499]|uniref:MarR family winged helix-turn-helix transcriptional regulator n=1 Tax=Actinomadura sp. WMMB 499 TaxID=1219491 RepID=UPI001247539B|nr:MarR family transcriptional regulator [Actinomadura sp. WMMB 499]QFG23062.1 MarR family transcriptional regulator [Actinomadura sp. WMMB 499]
MEAQAGSHALAEQEICGLVKGLATQLEVHVRERAANLRLTAPQATALRELAGPMTMRDLAERMSCEPSNATFIVDRLERLGLVERRPHPSDRRAKILALTPRGTGVRERLLAMLLEDSPVARLTQEEQRTLRELLLRATGRT